MPDTLRRAQRWHPAFARAGGLWLPTKAPAAWTPASLPNLVAWYDASDTASITQSSGAVSQWNDKSGNLRHLLQGTGARQPTTAVDTINGFNVLKFVRGNNSFLSVTGVTIAQPLTMLAVVKKTASTGNLQIVGNDQGTATLFVDNTKWAQYAGSTVQDSSATADVNAHQLVGIYNGASSQLWLDAVSVLAANPGAGGKTGLTIGSDTVITEAWDGDIAELAFMSSAIGSTDRALWNTYCARWGL